MKHLFSVRTLAAAICLSASFGLFGLTRVAAQSDDLLSVAKVGCDRAVNSITSGRGKVTVSSFYRFKDGDSRPATENIYNFAFKGPRWGMSYETAGGLPNGAKSTLKMYCDGKKVTVLDLGPRKVRTYGSERALQNTVAMSMLPYGHGLYRIGGAISRPGSPAKNRTWRVVDRESLNGDDCIVVEMAESMSLPDGQTGSVSMRFWVDPSKGYTVPLVRTWNEGGGLKQKFLFEETTVQLKDYGHGLWAPSQWTYEQYRLSKTGERQKAVRLVTKYDSKFAFNVPVSDADLLLTIPSRDGKVSGKSTGKS